MSIAVPVAILVLLSANAYGAWIWPNYEPEQKDKSEQADESASKKDKSGKAEKSSSAVKSKAKRHRQTRTPGVTKHFICASSTGMTLSRATTCQ
jgi:hypothetical protein